MWRELHGGGRRAGFCGTLADLNIGSWGEDMTLIVNTGSARRGEAAIRKRGLWVGATSAGLAAAAVLAFGAVAWAQDDAQVEAGLDAWKLAGCSTCHGKFGEGGGGGAEPEGPSLRDSRLDGELLVESISCGRPGTGMPSHLVGAYTEIDCYGMPVGQIPEKTAVSGSLTTEQITALVSYLLARVVGKEDITAEECGLYYRNPNYPPCGRYQ